MLVNAPAAYTSALEELWAGGFASGGVSIDWTTEINALPHVRVSRPGAICN